MGIVLILLVMNLFYAGTPSLMKVASGELGLFQIVFLRHTLALLAFLPFFLLAREKKIRRNDFFKVMLGSFLSFTVASLLQILAMRISFAADGSFILAMEPILVIVLAALFLKERLDPKMMGGLVLAMIGFMYLSSGTTSAHSTSDRWAGNLIFLLAVGAEASFPILLKPLLKQYSPIVIAFYSLLCASFYMLPFQGAELAGILPGLHWKTLGSVIYLGLGCSFLASFLWLKCLARFTASFVAVSWFVQPLFGCFFASLLIQEALSPNIWVGGAFIFAALACLAAPKREKAVAPDFSVLLRVQDPLWTAKPVATPSFYFKEPKRRKEQPLRLPPHFGRFPRHSRRPSPIAYH